MSKTHQIHSGVWTLALTSFAIGVAEFIVVGVLPAIASYLNISLAKAGGLIGLYALSLAIGTPIVVLSLSKVSKKLLLLAFVAIFTLGNLISALSISYELLLAGRIMTAIAHGSFFAIGASVAAQLSAKGQESRAIAVMFGGLTLAMVIGVPMGSFIGNALGWRLPFMAVVVLGSLALIATAKWVPSLSTKTTTSLKSQLAALKNPAILSMISITVLGFGASFPVFTFITPILTNVTGFSSEVASGLLVVFGIATLVGNMAGGHWAAQLGWAKALRRMLLALLVILVLLAFAMPYQLFMVPLLFIWGVLAFGMSPGFQAGMLDTANKWSPKAVDFASSLNISGFNLGITLGEFLGGYLVAQGQLLITPWAGVALTLFAFMPLFLVAKRNLSSQSDNYSNENEVCNA